MQFLNSKILRLRFLEDMSLKKNMSLKCAKMNNLMSIIRGEHRSDKASCKCFITQNFNGLSLKNHKKTEKENVWAYLELVVQKISQFKVWDDFH